MRLLLIVPIILVTFIFGNYWFNPYLPICRLPVEYTIGTFDERFGLSAGEARLALEEAEAIWEESLGREDIFSYNDSARLQVNFIYDERQRDAESAEQAREDLSLRGDANDVLVELHGQLVEEYNTYAAEYTARKEAFEENLAAYNAEVEKYNQQGGAPPEVYEELQNTRDELDQEREAINNLSLMLNDLVEQINSVGDKGNELVGEYNERVRDFNDNFAHGHEYTQGDYNARDINIYSFVSQEEMVLVLAHELGHSLSIGHVDDPAALMYYLMKDQPTPPSLSEADKQAFRVICEVGFGERLLDSMRALYNSVIS